MLPLTITNVPFIFGQTLIVKGVADASSTNFQLNICPDENDVALHINPRFNRNNEVKTVVCNSYQGGKWGDNRVTGKTFPFQQGKEFTITVAFSPQEFVVTLPDKSNIHYPNYIGKYKYPVLIFEGEASFTSVEIKE
ncbi:beta-galactoside-binding lectin-like [Synchiropus splendidus]|uniref:beta-galactoside-binding lectin-like n=1 Tax=Synchiropus splendidus TaxID=270530 RepID=UPI00237EDE73|nr:beta-galactoside-binding lectin-like [Synchiropus splendidus]XP_053707821.1 beta-galactoside-binding lectin-like [Synchiropus splendidus]